VEPGGHLICRKKKFPPPVKPRINAQPRLHQRAAGDSSIWNGLARLAARLGRTGASGDDRAIESVARRYHDVARSLQEVALAGRRADFLSACILLFDKHYGEQAEIVDEIAERIQLLGGVSLAMAADVAETTRIERPPRGREEVPVQISRLLDAHQIIIGHCRELAELSTKLGDAGTNDLVVSDVLRPTNLQVWFLSEHLVDVPLVHAPRSPDAAKS
jgi:DNA-binding ferritin-like protein